jgi:signal transduction histidine kinase
VLLCFSALLGAQDLITTYSVEHGLPQRTVTALYRDNDGYLWCGTTGGLVVYDGWKFHKPRTDSEKANPHLGAAVTDIIPGSDQQTVWVGADGVVMQFDRLSFHVKSSYDAFRQPGVSETPVYANDTAVWIACDGVGLSRVETSNGNATALTTGGCRSATAVHINATNQVCCVDSMDHLQFAGLKSSINTTVPLPAGVHSRDVNRVMAEPGTDHSLLLLTRNGIWQYDLNRAQFRQLWLCGTTLNDTLCDVVDLTVHANGQWWLSIRQQGVFAYSRNDSSFTAIDNSFSFPERMISDAYGVVWCANEQGLHKLLHGRYEQPVSSASMPLCFRTPLVLASYAEDDEEHTGIISESIIREYDARDVSLNIWQTDFAFPEQAVFSYRLDGAVKSPQQQETGTRELQYEDLSSGFYSLICSVTVPGCQSTPVVKLLSIKIIPPFWMSRWFIGISLMGIVLLITIVLFIIMRTKYQRKLHKLRMQQELDKVRARISRDIHDEIGAGLTRIALNGDLMSQKAAADAQQQEKLKWIAGTARELSQSMKEVVWSVNPHYDSLDHMVAYFRSYVADVAENADVRFRFVAGEELPAVEVNPETRRNLLLILKEAVSNAVKYSGCSELKLEVDWKNEIFTLKISDNGKGFDLNSGEKVNSNGLRNMQQRAEGSGMHVRFTSSSEGTTIAVSGPVDPSASSG